MGKPPSGHGETPGGGFFYLQPKQGVYLPLQRAIGLLDMPIPIAGIATS